MKEGWICPRCGKVNAPFAFQCDCKPEEQTTNVADEQCSCGGLHNWVCLDRTGASSSSAFSCQRVVLARCSKCGEIKTFDVVW